MGGETKVRRQRRATKDEERKRSRKAATGRKEGAVRKLRAAPLDDPGSEALPGYTRKRFRDKWRYLDANGKVIKDEAEIARIKKLVIPPAWTEVWICPVPDGKIQATGRDARGRKQYIYHPEWREGRESAKFARLASFGASLPSIREQVAKDLRKKSDEKSQLLGAAVALLDTSLIRIGNREYLKKNGSVGLTTMQRSACRIEGEAMRFRFKGKSGKKHDITVKNKKVARVLERCKALKGPMLLQYHGRSGECQALTSSEVNTYLRAIAGPQFSAKDFRTWAASARALDLLLQAGPAPTVRERKRRVNEVLADVSSKLGNTPTVCRKSYVHPAIFRAYEGDGFGQLKPAENPEETEANLLRFLRSVARRERQEAA